MRHTAAAARLSEYLEGSLSGRHVARVEAHLTGCPDCRRELGGLRRTVELLRGLRGGVDAPDIADAIQARIRSGEAEPSVLDRLWASVARFLSTPLGPPLATASVGLVLLAVLPRIEVEVSIPGRSTPTAATVAPAPQATAREPERPRPMHGPLLARRVNESLSGQRDRLASPGPFACLESSPHGACREQHAFMTKLAMENVWAFMAEIEELPETRRDDVLVELSRFAAESGAASDVAARLRATGDPQAQQIAIRFELAR